jgi:hypothetical protein
MFTKSAPLQVAVIKNGFFIVFFVIQQFSSCTSVYFPANCLFTNAFAKITLTGLKVY